MLIEVSPGEVVDKLTILKIKLEQITDVAKKANVEFEYNSLLASFERIDLEDNVTEQVMWKMGELFKVNKIIWDIEDRIRDLERAKDFGPEFIETARGVYFNNDRRAELKREINVLMASAIIEEKSYTPYQ